MEEEEEEEDDETVPVPDIVDEDYKDVEIVKPLDCIDKALIRSKSPSPRVKMRTKKPTPETTPQGTRQKTEWVELYLLIQHNV